MNKFFYYLLFALSLVGILVAIFFLLNAILGKGGDLPTTPSLAICIGSLFGSAVSWTIAKVLKYTTMRIEEMENTNEDEESSGADLWEK